MFYFDVHTVCYVLPVVHLVNLERSLNFDIYGQNLQQLSDLPLAGGTLK